MDAAGAGTTRRGRTRWRLYLGPLLFALLSVNCGAIEITPVTRGELTVPSAIAADEAFEVTGTGFDDGACRGFGCASCPAPGPRKNIDIMLRQGEKSWVLATVDANRRYEIQAEVTAPNDLVEGDAVIVAGESAEVTVEVVPSAP